MKGVTQLGESEPQQGEECIHKETRLGPVVVNICVSLSLSTGRV